MKATTFVVWFMIVPMLAIIGALLLIVGEGALR